MRRSSIIAVTVHAAALFALSRMPIRVVAPPPAAVEEMPILIEPQIEPLPQGSLAAPPSPPPDAAREPALRNDRERAPASAREPARVSARELASPPRAHEATEDEPDEPAVAPKGEEAVTLPNLTTATPDLALGGAGPNPFLPKSEAAVALAESKRGIGRALGDPARERETALGLGPEGPVLAALVEATARSTAPVRGRAIFVATADASGVFAMELRDSEGSRSGWNDARTIALAALKGKKLRLPAGATRAVMRIEVKSDWKLPSGHDPSPEVTLFHVPVKKGETDQSAKVSILDPIPKLRVVELPLDRNTKVPIVSLQIDLFATNMDPTDVGAKPRRVVHSRLVDSQVM